VKVRRAGDSFRCPLVTSHESGLIREHDSLDPVPELELGENAPDVRLDRGLAEGEAASQLGVAEAMGEQPQYLEFPARVGFQNSADTPDLAFYATRSYSLMRPPRTGRRLIRSLERSATG
jgi:hypothetical protein